MAGRPLAAALVLLSLVAAPGRGADGPLVETTNGPVRGVVSGNVRRFLGIPYAAPPLGDRRWRPPAKPTPWAVPRDASTPGSSCPQVLPVVDFSIGNEDCLFLNVFTPDPAHGRRPSWCGSTAAVSRSAPRPTSTRRGSSRAPESWSWR